MWVDDAFDDEERWAGILVNFIVAAVCFHYSQKNSRPLFFPVNTEEHKKEQKQNKENKQDPSLEILKKRYTPKPETTFGSVLRPEPETTPEPETKIHSTNTIKTNESDDPVEILKIRMSKGEITIEEIDKIPKSFFHSGGLPNSPLEILKKRYAIGEITLDEFNKIKENLEKLS